jgi:hypothetical protein
MQDICTKPGPVAEELMETALAQWEGEGGAQSSSQAANAAAKAARPAAEGGYELYVWRGGYWCFLKSAPGGVRQRFPDGVSRPAELPWFRSSMDRMPDRLFGTLQ